MKFFTRTFNSFLIIILLQAVLVIVFVSGRVSKSQEADFHQELKDESLNVYDNFNAWKRVLWGAIVDLNQSQQLRKIADAQPAGDLPPDLIAMIQKAAALANCEFIIVRNNYSSKTVAVKLMDDILPAPNIEDLCVDRPHPYIEMLFSNGALYFTGNLRIATPHNQSIDIFLAKIVNPELMTQLSFNKKTKAIAFFDNYLVGDPALRSDFLGMMENMTFENAYVRINQFTTGGEAYGLILQQSGTVKLYRNNHELRTTLFVCTFFPRKEYKARITFINRSVLLISMLVAIFTIAMSVGLSKAVTDPIRQLRNAMVGLKRGERITRLPTPHTEEIADLFHGFDEMSVQIAQDKQELSLQLNEITHIKDYTDTIFDSIQEKILVINSAFIIEKANQSFLNYCGKAENMVVGCNIDEVSLALFDEPIHASIRAIMTAAKPMDTQIRRSTHGHSFEIKFYPLLDKERDPPSINCIMIIEDVTARLAYEEKIRLAEKLASLSMLSAGVAHEINNPLSSILINIQNLISTEYVPERLEDLKLIEQETKRIARIVHNLLEFASCSTKVERITDVNYSVEKVLRLLGYSIKKESSIIISTELSASLPHAAIREDEFNEILINLIKNAIEAIGSEGQITIKTIYLQEKSMVECSVDDTGQGIPESILPRIFDPFFSTKGDYGNSGLGLSIVYGLVQEFNGEIEVESKEGYGSCIRIRLPVANLSL